VKLHSPPRLSKKIIHTLRHAAAKAVQELGLNRPGAAVLVSGWADVNPAWRQRYARPDDFLEKYLEYEPSEWRVTGAGVDGSDWQ